MLFNIIVPFLGFFWGGGFEPTYCVVFGKEENPVLPVPYCTFLVGFPLLRLQGLSLNLKFLVGTLCLGSSRSLLSSFYCFDILYTRGSACF